jgi:lysophospholipase L1-like esterase
VSACRLGVLAFGDSITNGGGELQWGVALQSWALWVARALALPYSPFAVDGARIGDVLAHQLPAVAADARYDLGCLYVGVNDVRAPDWDRAAFERGHRTALAFLAERCERVLTMTVPLDLGRPRAGAKVHEVNAAIEASAGSVGALVVDLRDFGARNLVMTDHVHPTAFGQIAIAERALAVLAADGLPARRSPAAMISYETTRWRRLRGDLTYVYRHSKVSARAAWDRYRAGRSGASGSGR